MNTERNKDLVRRIYLEIYNNRDLTLIDEIYAEDFVSQPNSINPEGIHGPQGMRRFVTALLHAFPDIHFEILDELAEADRVITRWIMSATLRGELFGFPPTGKAGVLTGITIHRIGDGKLAEAWEEADMLGAFAQFGITSTSTE